MDIANLRAFAAVAAGKSFSSAATQLHITQPAVSKRIAVLEAELDAPLFDRLGRRIELTEAGRALLRHLPEIEQSLRQAERAVRDINGEISGPLRIATSHHIGLHRLPPVLSSFQRRYPSVNLAIEFLDSEQAYERLRVGDIELAVVTLAPGDVSQLHSEVIWTDELSVMICEEHALAGRHRVRIAELAEHPAVLPGLDTFTGQIVHQHFDAAGASLQLRMATNYLETLRMMAVVGLGWTVLPGTMAGPELQTLRVENTRLSRSLGLVHHQERSLSRSASAFLTLLRETGKAS
ncbi:LysR family transcriptional regulator [Congregibacter litoralis]|uniref:Transcriptional regulator, LysR family n=1 Tax=Congregibacter litoralis KT71 TaxID=314285 RepID=A4A841_9GAMM|nr:LysR family transcriptional regulator [Congregibacter litoralis]EAQ97836.1 transcriptional regulator, LysR family [Congregibacter litoralis KT71]